MAAGYHGGPGLTRTKPLSWRLFDTPDNSLFSLDFPAAPGILCPTAGRGCESIGGKREYFKGRDNPGAPFPMAGQDR